MVVVLTFKEGIVVENEFNAAQTINFVDRIVRLKEGNSEINVASPNKDGEYITFKAEDLESIQIKY
ncbi:hypothetical protein BSK54_08005 [Paenibacillus odorifer]|jgi:hypothetical protein|uniref:hypothetical protein n=1 Tax=Paenibacillus odorifer TaxID=189426 RepID=UPI00096C013B|nr:hypothetical protein [Paenibacillus odorifer]OME03385.1 hypothetical protein BSK54_08005 [Paenibacillus odorifer]